MTAGHGAVRGRLRGGVIVGIVLIIGAYASVLYEVANVAGVVLELAVILFGAGALATLLARVERSRTTPIALGVAAALLVGGAVAYVAVLPPEDRAILTSAQLLADTYSLFTGMSVLQIVAAGSWALAVTPGPTFLAWFLAMRGDHTAAMVVSSSLLGLFVLTGDAGLAVTLAGVVGAATVLVLGSLLQTVDEQYATDRFGGRQREPPAPAETDDGAIATIRQHVRTQIELLTVILAVMVLVSAAVGGAIGASVSAGGGGGSGGGGDGARGTTGPSQASLVNTSDQLAATGSISLSPRVRFLVHSNQSTYWRTAAYDRYTGDGWVRTGQLRPYEGDLDSPPGQSDRIEQTVEPQTTLGSMPAANQPVSVGDEQASQTLVSAQRTIEPSESLDAGENYTVVSRQPTADPDTLRAADDYGDGLDRYRQLPESTPDRVAEQSAVVAGNESTAYDKAAAIERYLEANKGYSTLVQQPDGDVADGFLFDMNAGYCTYFATTMAVMLRSQDVPTRVAVGYTPGQRLERNGTDVHVVRGYDAHAWVEVYFQDVGWVAFDPTPSDPRALLEYQRLTRAREQGTVPGIDAAGSSLADPERPGVNNTSTETAIDPQLVSAQESESTQQRDGPLPTPRTIGLWLVGLVGLAAITRRSGGFKRVRTAFRRYYQPRRSPTADVERAWHRVETELARRHRPRASGESARSYVQSIEDDRGRSLDSRIHEVLTWYERARYGGEVDPETADAAVDHADALTRTHLPVIGGRYR